MAELLCFSTSEISPSQTNTIRFQLHRSPIRVKFRDKKNGGQSLGQGGQKGNI